MNEAGLPRALDPEARGDVLASILERGDFLTLRDFPGQGELHRTLVASIRAALRDLCPGFDGELERLHEALPASSVAALRDRVLAEARPALFRFACRIGRELLGIQGTFFVDDYTILRVNFPYRVAREAPPEAENPGIGRIAPSARDGARSRRVVDPAYDPRGFHRGEPPAAWAHGPHRDTWTGHSRDGVNLWWALTEVSPENGMTLYPELFAAPLAPDPRSLYLREGFPLPRPTKLALAAGELFVFNPELPHATHLNVTDRTRLAVSLRLNARRPTFSPTCFYARELWQSSDDVEAGRTDAVQLLRREENLGPPPPPFPEPPPRASAVCPATRAGEWCRVGASESLPPGAKVLVERGEERVVVARTPSGGLRAFAAACPHLGVSLMDGFHDDSVVHCPTHAVDFTLADGRSRCPTLSLETFDVREEEGTILLGFRRLTS